MHTIQTSERTNSAGTLSLTIPLDQPNTDFDVLVVVQPKALAKGAPRAKAELHAQMDAIRNQLAATGLDFGESVDDIREDRDR